MYAKTDHLYTTHLAVLIVVLLDSIASAALSVSSPLAVPDRLDMTLRPGFLQVSLEIREVIGGKRRQLRMSNVYTELQSD